MGRRRRARELVLQGLYALEISGNSLEMIIEDSLFRGYEDEDMMNFVSNLMQKSMKQKNILDKNIATTVKNWNYERIALIDRLILRLALCELIYFEEIPPKVTINEAIDLAKKYSTAESGRFVNGILDAIYQKYKLENQIVKRGRGLME
jgi:N utilization substance protein B